MAGFNLPYRLSPELLAQIDAAGFRPPPAMGMPGLSMSAPPPAPGFSLRHGIADLAAGLGALKGLGLGGLRTPNGDPNDNRPYMAGGVDPRLIDPLTGFPRRGLQGPI